MTCLLSVITTRNFLVTFLHCVASWKLLPLPFWAWTFIVIQDGFFLLNINICSLDRWGFCSNTPIVFACWWKKGEVKNNPVIQKDVNPETPDWSDCWWVVCRNVWASCQATYLHLSHSWTVTSPLRLYHLHKYLFVLNDLRLVQV